MYSEPVLTSPHQNPHPRQKTVIDQLSDIILGYLKSNPRISLNGLSKRCQVSEPTIRRIAKKQVKTVPNVSTVLDLLTTISRRKNVNEIVALYPGPVADLIKTALPHLEDHAPEYSSVLNNHLRDPLRFLIFKLSLNKMGVSKEKIRKLFGENGVRELEELIKLEVVEKREQRYFSVCRSFTTSYDNFVEQFRAFAGFIKPQKVSEKLDLNPLFVMATESVSIESYKEITKVQRAALKKISQIVSSDQDGGPIPLFFLSALDTLDVDSAYEIANRGATEL